MVASASRAASSKSQLSLSAPAGSSFFFTMTHGSGSTPVSGLTGDGGVYGRA